MRDAEAVSGPRHPISHHAWLHCLSGQVSPAFGDFYRHENRSDFNSLPASPNVLIPLGIHTPSFIIR